MRIGIISQSPLWATGFGVTCNKIASALMSTGHEVVCFSLGETAATNAPFVIFPIDWGKALHDLNVLLSTIALDALLINYDLNTVAFFVRILNKLKWPGKIFAHIVIDGFPVYKSELEAIRAINSIVVPTKVSLNYLVSKGLKNVNYAPHGVNHQEFIVLKNKQSLKTKFHACSAINGKYLIGVFAKNEERKQIPKILLALHYLIYNCAKRDIALYLHTQINPEANRGWYLESIIKYLNLTDYVVFPSPNFLQNLGIDKHSNDKTKINYVELINMCDLIVNIPFSGGFELCNIEAQACGVPLITIDDGGNIKEVVGNSALLITPSMKNIWGNGAAIYLVDEIELSESILKIKDNPDLSAILKQKGILNSKKYNWEPLQKAIQEMMY